MTAIRHVIGMERPDWQPLAASQHGVIARRQLLRLGYDRTYVRRQVEARRWVERTSTVISTTTGPPIWGQRVWTAVLHAGGTALVGGLTALEWRGLANWHREEITVLVDDELSFDPVPGIRYFRTRRPLDRIASDADLPLARPEPAALLFGAYGRSARTAQGLLAAVVQQGLVTPDGLAQELHLMRPLRRAKLFRSVIAEISGGAGSLAELDIGRLCRQHGLPPPRRQTRRRDSSGRTRFTDCEWSLANGQTLILEIDGAFHMDAAHWEDDLARQRRLSGLGRTIVRCTARELRTEPHRVLDDLRRLGLCA